MGYLMACLRQIYATVSEFRTIGVLKRLRAAFIRFEQLPDIAPLRTRRNRAEPVFGSDGTP
jgi:hypothetical protein